MIFFFFTYTFNLMQNFLKKKKKHTFFAKICFLLFGTFVKNNTNVKAFTRCALPKSLLYGIISITELFTVLHLIYNHLNIRRSAAW